MPKHVYIHIPFCTNKCHYCDFNVFVWQGDDWVLQYLEALERELEWTIKHAPATEIDTIYVGGGTPSILNEVQMEAFLKLVHKYFPNLKKNGEFSLEVNPGTVTIEKYQVMRDGGVNRLSIGVQTFDDQLLKGIGRLHTGKEAMEAVALARKAGFTNISVDLMLGLPNQTMKHLNDSIDTVKRLNIEHVSAYSLKVEEHTVFHRWLKEKRLPLPPEELEVEMYLTLIERLEAMGIKQYEISNFAREGKESNHNLAYWFNREYYGIGAGAHGYVDGIRHENIGPIRPYMRATKEGLPRGISFRVTDEERMEEMMFMGLRLKQGISFARFQQEWGRNLEQEYGDVIQRLQSAKLLEVDNRGIRLTKQGMLLGNEVFSQFLKEKAD